MAKEEEIIQKENLQQEIASLTAERDALKTKVGTLEKDVEELRSFKDYWYKQYETSVGRCNRLVESMKGLRSIVDAIINQ
jgi:chromosome segregation ATPase